MSPHTINLADENSICLTQDEARKKGMTITKGNDECRNKVTRYAECNEVFLNRSASNPFYEANTDMLSVAWSSGGNFYPVYPEPDQSCTEENVNTSCKQATLATRRTIDPQCRTRREQLEDIINDLMNEPVFKSVSY